MESAAVQTAGQTQDSGSESDFLAAVESAKLRALYNFAYGLSHEINNPLANIATRAQTLLADEKDPDRRRKLATIVQQSFRAHEMIADLMLFAHPPRMRPRETDLVQLIDTVISELRSQAHEQNTRLQRVGDNEALKATVDPTALAVAIKAILQNGLEAVKNNGSVEISCEVVTAAAEWQNSGTEYSVLSTQYIAPDATPHERHFSSTPSSRNPQPATIIHTAPLSPVPCPLSPSFVPRPLSAASFTPHSALRAPRSLLLSITDTGPGIPPDVRPNIFDPFFCGREAGRGLGLGLSKAWRIVDFHGGRIEVASEPGQGATFRVILPAN
jgi:signal transduction histidine kinase